MVHTALHKVSCAQHHHKHIQVNTRWLQSNRAAFSSSTHCISSSSSLCVLSSHKANRAYHIHHKRMLLPQKPPRLPPSSVIVTPAEFSLSYVDYYCDLSSFTHFSAVF
jgi:hypothetical protein